MAKIDTDFIVGKPSARNWSGVLGYRPETDTLIEIFGEMFAVMSIRSEIDFDLANVGGLLFDELQSCYFSEFKPAIELSDFEAAVQKVKTRVDAILEREEELSQTGIDLEMAISVVKGQVLYLAVIGESKVYVSRQENFAEVGNALIDSEMNGFMRTGSMYLTPGDTLMLMTSVLANDVGSSKSRKSMEEFTFSKLEASQGAALMVGYDHPEKVVEEHPVFVADEGMEMEIVPRQSAASTVKLDELSGIKSEVAVEPVEIDNEADEFIDDDMDPELDAEELPVRRADIVQPIGHVAPDDEDMPESHAVVEPLAVRARQRQMQAEQEDDMDFDPRDVAAGASILDKFKPHLAKAKVVAAGLLGKAKVGAMGLKDKAVAMRGGKPSHREMDVEHEDIPELRPRIQHADLMEDEEEMQQMPADVNPVMDRQARVAAANRGATSERFNRFSNQSGSTIQTLIAKAIKWFKTNILGQADRQDMYLRGGRGQRNWRVLAIIGAVILVVLFLGIRKVAQDREYQAAVLTAQGKINDFNQRYENLNLQVTTLGIGTQDESKKSTVINDLNKLMNDARAYEQDKIFITETKLKNDVENIINRSQSAADQAANIVAFTQPQVVADVGVNFQGVDLSHLTYSNGKIYVADKGRGVVYRMGTSLNSETTAFVSGLVNPNLLKAMPNGDLMVIDDNPDSCVATIDFNSGAVKRQSGLSKSKIGTLSAIDIWENNGALYSISQEKKSLLKQENVAGNFQLPNDANPWRKDNDFASGIDIAVDGFVWTLVRGKGIVRFLAGESEDITYVSLLASDKNAINQATAFDITATNVYIADPLNKRVLVFTKSTTDNKLLTFKQQYVYRGTGAVFTKIKDLVANEETKKLYVLDGTQVIRLDL